MSRIKAYRRVLEGFAAESRLRTIPGNHNRSEWLDMTSNDYMGLSSMHDITDEFHKKQGYEYPSFSASASRLLALDQTHHMDLSHLFICNHFIQKLGKKQGGKMKIFPPDKDTRYFTCLLPQTQRA